HGAAGDHALAGAARLQEHLGAPELSGHVVRDSIAGKAHFDEVLLGIIVRLLDGIRHIGPLGDADPDLALAVTDNKRGAEAETPPALDDAGNAGEVEELLFELRLLATDHFSALLCHRNVILSGSRS